MLKRGFWHDGAKKYFPNAIKNVAFPQEICELAPLHTLLVKLRIFNNFHFCEKLTTHYPTNNKCIINKNKLYIQQ